MTESVSESLQQCIAAGARAGIAMTQLVISDDAAWDLARELAALQMHPFATPDQIYLGLVEGGIQFMGLRVIVAADEAVKPGG